MLDHPAPVSLFALLDHIRSIALEGLKYGGNEYDKVRYQRLLDIVSQQYGEQLALEPTELINTFRTQIGINTPKVGVDVITIDQRGYFLTLKRADDATWCLPGGWMDIGESPEQTAQRELLEEAGIQATPYKYVMCVHKGPHLAPYLYHQVSLVIMMQRLCEAPIVTLSHEHTDYAWIKDINDRTWHYGHDTILNKLIQHRKKTGDIYLEDYPDHIMISL